MSEPILWAKRGSHINRKRVVVDGEVRFERVPQIGHSGDQNDPRRARGKRWEKYVQNDGAVLRVPVTNAAAHLDDTTAYAAMIRSKARHLGWFLAGTCPCAMLASGDLHQSHVADKSLLTDTACPPRTYNEDKPCPHVEREIKARADRHKRLMDKVAKDHVPEVEKLLAGQKEQTTEIAQAVAEATKAAVTEIAKTMRVKNER